MITNTLEGVVGTVQFQSGDDHIDLLIPISDEPLDLEEDEFEIELEQPINAKLGERIKCRVTMLNDKSQYNCNDLLLYLICYSLR